MSVEFSYNGKKFKNAKACFKAVSRNIEDASDQIRIAVLKRIAENYENIISKYSEEIKEQSGEVIVIILADANEVSVHSVGISEDLEKRILNSLNS